MYSALIEEACDASDLILSEVLKIEKPPSILTTRGLLVQIRSLLVALRRAAAPAEREALERIVEIADRDWQRTADVQKPIRAMAKEMAALGSVVAAATAPVFEKHGIKVFSSTRTASKAKFRLPVADKLSDVDRRLVKFVSESQTNFVTDEYRRRSATLSKRMRKLVGHGLEENLFRDPFTKMLAKDAELMTLGRSKHYFDVVSRIYINRGRTLSSLSSYQEAGVTRYEFVAVRDSRTSDICRHMHGKSWDVKTELDRFSESARLRDPEKIRDLSPFVQRGVDKKTGKPILYYKKGGKRHKVADILESGVGQRMKRGRLGNALTNKQLQARGIAAPPLHGA